MKLELGLLFLFFQCVYLQNEGDPDVCDPTDGEGLEDNEYRCNGMPCDANYQCFTLNCG